MNDLVRFAALVLLALAGAATLVVASYPLHLAIVRRRARRRRAPSPARSLSVIVPLCGEEEGLAGNLAAIAGQTHRGPIEIRLVAERADDPALAIARKAAARVPGARVAIVVAGTAGEDLGKAHNLAAGLAAATGEIFVLADSDARPPDPAFLSRLADAFDDPAVGLVTCVPGYRGAQDPGAAWVAAMVNTDVAGLFAIHDVWRRMTLANGTCMAVRAEVFAEAGGLDGLTRRLLVDTAIARRVVALGRLVAFHAEPIPIHRAHLSLAAARTQAHRWHVAMRFGLPAPAWLGLGLLRAGPPLACAAFLLVPPATAATIVATAAAVRVVSAMLVSRTFLDDRTPIPLLALLPLADLAATGAWLAALLQPIVRWRGRRYRVTAGAAVGRLPEVPAARASARRAGRPSTLAGSRDL